MQASAPLAARRAAVVAVAAVARRRQSAKCEFGRPAKRDGNERVWCTLLLLLFLDDDDHDYDVVVVDTRRASRFYMLLANSTRRVIV